MQIRKLNALRKSLGERIADKAFNEWLKSQASGKQAEKPDPVAEKLSAALKALEADKSLNLGQQGYSVRRAKGKGAKGFVIAKIESASTDGASKRRGKKRAAKA